VNAIGIGATMDIAAKYAGVSSATIFHWIRRGRREWERLNPVVKTDSDAPDGVEVRDEDPNLKPLRSEKKYLTFFNAIEEASAVATINWLDVVNAAAKNDPQWAWTMLRAKHPESYGAGTGGKLAASVETKGGSASGPSGGGHETQTTTFRIEFSSPDVQVFNSDARNHNTAAPSPQKPDSDYQSSGEI
jgi:hypothetical protein